MWASNVGISESQIQILGRWRSDAYKLYIEYLREQRINLSQRFQRGQKPTQAHHTSRLP